MFPFWPLSCSEAKLQCSKTAGFNEISESGEKEKGSQNKFLHRKGSKKLQEGAETENNGDKEDKQKLYLRESSNIVEATRV